MRKRLLSILLVVCLVLPLVPDFLPANAEETTDAFGIRMEGDFTDDEKESKLANNPYGTEGWHPLFTVSELFVAKGHSDGRWWNTYNYNKDGGVGTLNAPTSGQNVGSKSEGNDNGFSIVDTAAVDAYGEGQKRYTAVFGYWKDAKYLQLFLANQNGNRLTNPVRIGPGKTLDYLDGAETHNNTGFISVTAGDFDGDGIDSIVIYRPDMVEDNYKPSIQVYNIKENNGNLQLQYSSTIRDVYDLLGIRNIASDNDNDGKVRKNAPVVQLLSDDTDNDGIDELVITAGLNNCSANGISRRHSQLFIYDYGTRWSQTYKKEMNDYSSGTGTETTRLRWASSDIGNLITSNNTTDFPEIVSAGWVDRNNSDGDNVTDEIGVYITNCVETKEDESVGTSVGTYESRQSMQALTGSADDDGNQMVSEFTSEGHFEGDDVQSLLPVSVFLADGVNASASVLIADTVYTYDTSGSFTYAFRGEYFNDDDDGIGGSLIQNNLVQDSVKGNFDGNNNGREQVIFTVCQKRQGRNDYWFKVYAYQKNDSGDWSCTQTNGYDINQIGNAYVSLCPVDVDNDSTIARVKEVSRTYTEPEVLTILEASPYFKEVDDGDTGNSETAYGQAQGSETGNSVSTGLSTQVVAGFEYGLDDITAGFTNGFGFEATVEYGFTYDYTNSTSVEYELNYSNDSGDNMVIVYRRPVTTWRYEVKNSDSLLVLAREGTLVSSMISVDEYNMAAGQYNLSAIDDNLLGEPGNPFSYRESGAGLDQLVLSQDVASYKGEGTISQTFSYSESTENSFSYETNESFSAYGIVFGIKVGTGGNFSSSYTSTTINTSTITKTGAVTSKNVDGYDFNWQFAHWVVDLNDQEVPVLGYVVSNVIAPPSPPLNLSVDDITSSSATLKWDFGNREADEYRIYQIYDDGDRVQIGVADGTENTFDLTKLRPDTTYTYAISAYSAGNGAANVYGESVLSEEVIVTTLPEGIATVEIESPENTSAKIGGTATFQAGIYVNSDEYNATNYQWQKREDGGRWEDISGATRSTLTLSDVQEEDDGTEYRCVFKVSYTSATSLIRYYSDAATLTVGQTAVETVLTVTGHDETGNGTLNNPYKGKSDYQVQSGSEQKIVITNENVIIPEEDGRPALTVYYYNPDTTDGSEGNTGEPSEEEKTYYGIGQTDDGTRVYYHVTKDGEDYEVGSPILSETETSYIAVDDDNDDTNNQQITDAEPAFNGQVTVEVDEKVYTLQASVTGTPKTPVSNVSSDYAGTDSRLDAVTTIDYYWLDDEGTYYQDNNGAPGKNVNIESPDTLYDVYYRPADKGEDEEPPAGEGTEESADSETDYIVLGRTETWTVHDTDRSQDDTRPHYDDEEQYIYTRIVVDDSNENVKYSYPTCFTISQQTRYYDTTDEGEKGQKLEDFSPGVLAEEMTQRQETVSTPVYRTEAGNSLQLKATVHERGTEGNETAASNAMVDFYVTNIETNAVQTISATTDETGTASATWTAATTGLYSIQAVVRAANGYASSQTGLQYYDAHGTYNTEVATEYRLQLLQGRQPVAGSINYGESVTLQLQQRTITYETVGETVNEIVSDWTEYAGAGEVKYYRVDEADNAETGTGTSLTEVPLNSATISPSAGDYTYRAYVTENEKRTYAAAASLQVKRLAVTITPEWDTNPESADDVTLTPDPELVDRNIDLKEIFAVSSSYFNLTQEEKSNTYGRFTVSLSYQYYPDDNEMQQKVDAFSNNYMVTLNSDTFTKAPGSAQIVFSSGENGSLIGQYSDNNFPLESGASKTYGTQLLFQASAESGYDVDYWEINGEQYWPEADNLPDGMFFEADGKRLRINSLSENHVSTGTETLTIYVQFKSVASVISYGVADSTSGSGEISAKYVTGESLSNNTSIANGSSVIFTAEPDENSIVDHWTVNGTTYYWDGTREIYKGNTLTLNNITGDQEVVVYFTEKAEDRTISTSVVNEGGQPDASLATITAANAETGNAISFENGKASITDSSSLTFTATVANTDNNMVKEWQVSAGDGTYTTIEGSGGQNSITLYNITENMDVRVVVTTAQTHQLTYSVAMNDESVVPEGAVLTAVSNGQNLASGNEYSAFIPVDFNLKLPEGYYVTKWSDNVSVSNEDNKIASLASLTGDTTVTVTIAKRPTLTIEETQHGTITVTVPNENAGDGETGETTLQNGAYLEPGTDLTVTFTPEKGYVVDETKVNDSAVTAVYADADTSGIEEGSTTDTKVYTIENVSDDQKISATFTRLAQHKITYSTIAVSADNNAHGTVSASAERKGMDNYKMDSLTSGDNVYAGSSVTFTAVPETGYRVQEWRVDGEIYTQKGVTVTSNSLTLSDISAEHNVTVQFVQLGNKMTISAGDNGEIASAKVGNLDQTANIASGFTLAPNASVVITAEPDAGYEVERWEVNGEDVKVDGGDELYSGTVYTYTADSNSTGANINVYFRQITYPVSWGATGGTVTAAATGENLDSVNKADIRGGTAIIFTASPEEGMKLSHWTISGEVADSDDGMFDNEKNTFTWTVPNGAAQDPPVKAYAIQAVFTEAPYTVTFENPEEHGTLSASIDGRSIETEAEVVGNTEVTFTVTPEDGWIVGSWVVTKNNGTPEVIDSKGNNSTTLAITANTHVTANMVPDSYTVNVSTSGKGTVTVNEETNPSYTAPYGSSMTFTAQPDNDYWQIDHWSVFDKDKADITDEVSGTVSGDKSTFTLSNITKDMTVECVFTNTLGYDLSYSVVNSGDGIPEGSLSVTADGESIVLGEGQTTTVAGGSKLVFTANPPEGYMVDCWTVQVNGEKMEDLSSSLSKTLTIDTMTGNTHVEVSFTQYVGYDIPVSDAENGYEIKDLIRVPDDTAPTEEIRKNGDLTFTVAPDESHNTIGSLVVNRYDCITGELTENLEKPFNCDQVTAVANDDGSFTVTIKNVTDNITLSAKAHNLTHVTAKDPTCTETGNIEYWICSDTNCNNASRMFADAKGTQPLDKENVILPADSNGHNYGEPVFTWDGTSSAKAAFTCAICNDVKTVDCTVSTKENVAQVTYTATASFNGKTYTDEKVHKHNYGEPVFTWNGTDSAKAVFTCSQCGETKTINCSVTTAEDEDRTTWTATATFNGQTYTSVKTEDKSIDNYDFRLEGKTAKKSIKLTWTKVPAADGYDIYWAKCEKKMKKVKTINNGDKTKWTNKKRKANSNHKYYVRAFKIVNGQKQYVNTSNTVHLAMPTRFTNVKKVKAAKNNLVLRKNKSQKLKVRTIFVSRNKRLVSHMDRLSFISSNRRVATVNSKGIVKAKSSGSCYIYITAASGAYTKVRVTVR